MRNFNIYFRAVCLTGILLVIFATFLPAAKAESANIYASPRNAISHARKRTTHSKEEIQELTNSKIDQQSLAKALKIKQNSANVIPELEEFIVKCYWQLGKQNTAIELARIYLMTYESPAMHKILLKDAIARKDLDKALFHYEKSQIRLANKPFILRELLALKYGRSTSIILAMGLIILISGTFYFFKKRRKATAAKSKTAFSIKAPVLPPVDTPKPIAAPKPASHDAKETINAAYAPPLINKRFSYSNGLTESLTALKHNKPDFAPVFSDFEQIPANCEAPPDDLAPETILKSALRPILELSEPTEALNANKAGKKVEPAEKNDAQKSDLLTPEKPVNNSEPENKSINKDSRQPEIIQNIEPEAETIVTDSVPNNTQSKSKTKKDEFLNEDPFNIPEFEHEKALTDQISKNNFEKFFNQVEQTLAELDTRVVGITSSSDITNRTCFAFVLGKLFAQKGHETLIIDADFSRPLLNLFTDSPCMYGLKHLLMPSDQNQEIYVKTEIPKLAIFPSGTPDEKQKNQMGEDFWNLTLAMSRLRFARIILVLPDLKKLENIKLYKEKILMLTLLNPELESSINEYFYSKIMLKRYDMKLFKIVKVQESC
jgi:LPXTG-motif cell wall-anchored protein